MSKELLIFVHPASLCGSYHTSPVFNEEQLRSLLEVVHNHKGPKVSIDGDFMDELPSYREIEDAYWQCDENYEAEPFDADLGAAAKAIAHAHELTEGDTVLLVGAWADAETGCVTTVAKWLSENTRATVTVSPHCPSYDEVEGEDQVSMRVA